MALAEFAQHLRYAPALHWAGSEQLKLTLWSVEQRPISAVQSWALVQGWLLALKRARCIHLYIYSYIYNDL